MEPANPEKSKYNSIRQWFQAGEDAGEYVGIRFGRIAPGGAEPIWQFYNHKHHDGIGAFADILRHGGYALKQLPQIKYYPAYSAVGAALKHWPRYLLPKRPLSWKPLERDGSTSSPTSPPSAVAWHVFDADQTQQIRFESRKNGYTVNTLLLKALTDTIRPSLEIPQSVVPWMIPVNMRGGVQQYRDTDNHTSYVAARIAFGLPAFHIHHQILRALSQGEHWGNWHAFKLGRCLSRRLRTAFVVRGLCMSQWSVGAFSNLGEWDPDRRLTSHGVAGQWLFCPPALRSQQLAAGCVTFQGRLSLTIQSHPELTTSLDTVRTWVRCWAAEVLQVIKPTPASLDSGAGAAPRPRLGSRAAPVPVIELSEAHARAIPVSK